MDQIDSKAAIHKAFYEMGLQFLEASIAAWPEDLLLPIGLATYRNLSHDDSVMLFLNNFGQLIDRLSKREEAALFEVGAHPQLAALEIEAKYKGANATTKETMWTYITHMCRFASMDKLYKHIPTQILGAVNEAAMSLKAQLDAGTVDASAINPFELGQQVMSKFDPQQMESMMREMMGSPDAVNSMLSSMSSLVAGSGTSLEAISAAASMFASGNAGADPSVPNLDLGSLMKFMGPK